MSAISEMIGTHPQSIGWDEAVHDRCLEALSECAAVCAECADACLGESMVSMLVRCIRLNQDCADICEATARVLGRLTHAEIVVMEGQLNACMIACRFCGEECMRHADEHEHCRICASVCRKCHEACDELRGALGS